MIQELDLEEKKSLEEIIETINDGMREKAKKGRIICKANFKYNSMWNGKYYAIKQVAAVISEENDEIVVVTVYTFYF